jgi:DNA-binding winged helix-turn-helix (wHTH) protein
MSDEPPRSQPVAEGAAGPALLRFGAFELDLEAGQLLKNGRLVRLQPQPFKLLCLLTRHPGKLVTREQIQAALWTNETFVDFEQGVNFAIKQVREALNDQAENPVYVQTVPKRGYRFVAPVVIAATPRDADLLAPPKPQVEGGLAPPKPPGEGGPGRIDPQLDKAVWANIVELRLADERRGKRQTMIAIALVIVVVAMAALLLARSCAPSI